MLLFQAKSVTFTRVTFTRYNSFNKLIDFFYFILTVMAANQPKGRSISGHIDSFFKKMDEEKHASRRDTGIALRKLYKQEAIIVAAAAEAEKKFALEEVRRSTGVANVEQLANTCTTGNSGDDNDPSVVLTVPGQPEGQDMALLFDVNNENTSDLQTPKRRYGKRPQQWFTIAQWHVETGRSVMKTVRVWQEYFHQHPDDRNKTTIARWVKDRETRLVSGRLEEKVVYGFQDVSHGKDIDIGRG